MSLDDELRDWAETRRGGDPTAADVQALLADAERPRERAPRTPWLLIGAGVSALALAAAVLMAVGVGARLAGSSLSPETHDPVPIAAPEPQRAVPEPVWTGHVAHDGDTFDIDGTLRPVADVPEDRYILDGTVAVEAAPRTHDRPLRIVTDRWEVTVIGTRFVVTSDPFAVEVTEGVVAVRGPDVEVSLRAGDAFRDGTVQRAAPAVPEPAPIPGPTPDLADLRALLRDGELDEAAQGLTRWVAREPGDAEAWRLLAMVEQRRGQPRPAIEAWRAVIAHGSPSQAQRARYEAATLLGPTPEAVALWDDFLATPDPLAPEARLGLAEALLASGDERGWTELQAVVDAHPGSAAAARARTRLAGRTP